VIAPGFMRTTRSCEPVFPIYAVFHPVFLKDERSAANGVCTSKHETNLNRPHFLASVVKTLIAYRLSLMAYCMSFTIIHSTNESQSRCRSARDCGSGGSGPGLRSAVSTGCSA